MVWNGQSAGSWLEGICHRGGCVCANVCHRRLTWTVVVAVLSVPHFRPSGKVHTFPVAVGQWSRKSDECTGRAGIRWE